jgi:hypothetical protein
MGGTEIVDGSSTDLRRHLSVPYPAASIRIDGIRAIRVVDDEDGPILIVTDGDATVEFSCGLSGQSRAAVDGVARLAQAVRAYALVVESGGEPLTPLTGADAARSAG